MPGIYVMAILTLTVSAAAYAGMLRVLTERWRSYLWLALPALPLSAVVNLLVKRRLAQGVASWASLNIERMADAPLWFLFVLLFLAPLTEEAIKVAPLLLPRARGLLASREDALWVGFTLGAGFGIGEAGYLAYGIGRSVDYAGLPWYAFTGYFGERLIVCFVHAAMTAVLVTGLVRGRPLRGYAGAVLLHALANGGAMAYQVGWVSILVANVALIGVVIVMAAIFERLRRQALREAPRGTPADGEVVLFQRDGPREQIPGR